jgi:ABC-2 type transport system permease protein
MRPYWAQLSASFQVLLRYRMAAAAGATTQMFWGFLRLSILTAFYAALPAGQAPPMSLPELAAYVWLGQALWGLMPLRAEAEIATLVREGGIAYELTRPVDLYGLWLSRAIAVRLAPTMLRLPIVLLVGIFLPRPDWALPPPQSAAAFGLFMIALVLAVLLAASFTALLGVTCLWTEGGNGVGNFIALLGVLTSGVVLPLPVLPDGLRSVLECLPFAGVSDLPLRIYSGHVPAAEATPALLRSAGWTCAVMALGWCSLRGSLRRVVAHGG